MTSLSFYNETRCSHLSFFLYFKGSNFTMSRNWENQPLRMTRIGNRRKRGIKRLTFWVNINGSINVINTLPWNKLKLSMVKLNFFENKTFTVLRLLFFSPRNHFLLLSSMYSAYSVLLWYKNTNGYGCIHRIIFSVSIGTIIYKVSAKYAIEQFN